MFTIFPLVHRMLWKLSAYQGEVIMKYCSGNCRGNGQAPCGTYATIHGQVGPRGERDEQGEQGPQGPEGDTGEQGPQGEKENPENRENRDPRAKMGKHPLSPWQRTHR